MSDLIIFFLAYCLLLIFGIVILRVVVRRDYLSRGRLSVPVSMLQAVLFFTYGGFPYLYLPRDWPAVHVPTIVHILGITFIIIGLAGLFYGMIKLGIFRSMGHSETKLQRSGIYSKTRNPQALACGLYVIGFTILWPSWQALAWAILYPILIHMMIITEEQYLLKIYGKEYLDYCQEVPRYLDIRSN